MSARREKTRERRRAGTMKSADATIFFIDFRSATFVLFQFLFSSFSHGARYFPWAETLLSWDLPEAVGRSTTQPQSQCLCQTTNCLCCVDLNLTATIDLGGPACINVKQKEQNVSLNLSYGDNPVHNATIKIGEKYKRSLH